MLAGRSQQASALDSLNQPDRAILEAVAMHTVNTSIAEKLLSQVLCWCTHARLQKKNPDVHEPSKWARMRLCEIAEQHMHWTPRIFMEPVVSRT